jgi:hypothetical protein
MTGMTDGRTWLIKIFSKIFSFAQRKNIIFDIASRVLEAIFM